MDKIQYLIVPRPALTITVKHIIFERRGGQFPVAFWLRIVSLLDLRTYRIAGRRLGCLTVLGPKGRRLSLNRTGRETLFFGHPALTDGKGSFVVTGHVQDLGREGEIDSFGIEALHDPCVDPGGVIQIFPIVGRVVPVYDQNV